MILAIALLAFSAISIVTALVKMLEYQRQLDQFASNSQTKQPANIGPVDDVPFTESLLALGRVRLRDHDGSPAPEPVEVSSSASTRPGQSRTRVQEL
jgi:hypothetical protein